MDSPAHPLQYEQIDPAACHLLCQGIVHPARFIWMLFFALLLIMCSYSEFEVSKYVLGVDKSPRDFDCFKEITRFS